jgi:hypothetical protein
MSTTQGEFQVPLDGHPTEVLAARFDTWRKIIRAINVYFREVAAAQDDVVRVHSRLVQAMSMPWFQSVPDGNNSATTAPAKAPAISRPDIHGLDLAAHEEYMFQPYGSQSIGDIQADVVTFHRTQAAASSKIARELDRNIIPRLEELRRELLGKIKDIKACAGNFRNTVSREQQNAQSNLQQYISTIELLAKDPSQVVGKNDPYLLRAQVDRQLRRQVNEENEHLDSYLKFQAEGRELERVVAFEVQKALSVFAKLMGVQAQNINDLLANKILNGFVAKDPTWEWDQLIARDRDDFVDPKTKKRDVSEIGYQYQYSNLASEVRSGYLERRSKYLKSYSKAWYVLTPMFLHEFKSSDRRHDPHPVMSLSLDDCSVSTDDQHTSSSHKFVLHARQSGGVHRGHKWVFRAENAAALQNWFDDLSRLTALKSPLDRSKLLPGSAEGVAPMLRQGLSPEGTLAGGDRTISMRTQGTGAVSSIPDAVGAGVGATALGAGAGITAVKAASPVAVKSATEPAAAAATGTGANAVAGTGAAAASGVGAAAGAVAGTVAGVAGLTIATGLHHHHKSAADETDEYRSSQSVSSPVPSELSGVTSNGEPFQASEPVIEGDDSVDEVDGERRPERAALSSDVNLQHSFDADEAVNTVRHEAANFVLPSEMGNGHATAVDTDSVFSYDLKHTASTYKDDTDFEPVESHIPVHVERRLTMTHHKDEDPGEGIGVARTNSLGEEDPETLLIRRRSSVVSSKRRGPPSRRATGSFGTTDELKPLTNANGDEPAPLFFANGLPSTTGGSETLG